MPAAARPHGRGSEYRTACGTIISVAKKSNSNRIRVLWVIKGLGPGGAEQLLLSSAKVADHDQFHYEAAYVRPDKTHLTGPLAEAGVPSELLSEGPGGRFLWPVRLRRLMGRFDVVHAHSPLLAGVARIMARTLPRGRRPVTVSTEHNVWGNFALPTRLFNACTAPLDATRWSVSSEVQRSMSLALAAGAHVLIHGIVQTDAPTPPGTRARVRAELGLPDDAIVSLTVANLRKEKDYPNLLRAAKIALSKDRRLVMLAVGQGPLADEIAALHHELRLGDRFHLLGYRSDVPDLLAAADIFTLASEHEGLPVSIMEAMHAGLPVVATAVGGVPEAVTDGVTGRVVPPNDHRQLASALVALAGDADLRERMGTAARQDSARFDIRMAVAEQQAVYAELVR